MRQQIQTANDLRLELDSAKLSHVPVFDKVRQATTLEEFMKNMIAHLKLETFSFEQVGEQWQISQQGKLIFAAPTQQEVLMFLILTGAWISGQAEERFRK